MYVINHHIVPNPSTDQIQTVRDPQLIAVARQKELDKCLNHSNDMESSLFIEHFCIPITMKKRTFAMMLHQNA